MKSNSQKQQISRSGTSCRQKGTIKWPYCIVHWYDHDEDGSWSDLTHEQKRKATVVETIGRYVGDVGQYHVVVGSVVGEEGTDPHEYEEFGGTSRILKKDVIFWWWLDVID